MDDDNENAAELQFGAEFTAKDMQFLTNDDAFFLLSHRVETSGGASEIFQQTFSYLEKVVTTKMMDDLSRTADDMATQLNNLELELIGSRKKVKLHPFEVASLSNLIRADDTTPEEALSWIPSLSRFDDDEILKAINIVVELKEKINDSI